MQQTFVARRDFNSQGLFMQDDREGTIFERVDSEQWWRITGVRDLNSPRKAFSDHDRPFR
jgi:hypothetical protein